MKFFRVLIIIVCASAPLKSLAGNIDFNNITASTNLIESPSLIAGDVWAVEELVDGITSDAFPFYGFVSQSTSGTVSLAFDAIYNLNSFEIWNDLNVLNEGVRDFRLEFFDASAALIDFTDTFTAVSQLAVQTFNFATVLGVSRVDLVIESSSLQIEIREVAFNGTPVSVPEPSALIVLALGLLGLALSFRSQNASQSHAAS